jgi:glycosyltransferase involved in cell wall biosynthesis
LRRSPGGILQNIAFASIGDPRDAKTWSGTPRNLILALEEEGCGVTGFDLQLPPVIRRLLKGLSMGTGMGTDYMRTRATRRIVSARHRLKSVSQEPRPTIHMGTLTIPVGSNCASGAPQYIFVDSTFHLLSNNGFTGYGALQKARFDDLERRSFHSAEHLFAISEYVRDDLLGHYGIPPDRITVVGTGRGKITPYFGSKAYKDGSILFVAKERFEEKGGRLLLDAFPKLTTEYPKVKLIMVCERKYQTLVESVPNAMFKTSLPWEELESLFHQAALFAMPALHEPWGLVYLEALASRCAVLGLDRNALAEITGGGKYGFLVRHATPAAIADALISAFSDAEKLRSMAAAGQEHCLSTYSWARTAALIRQRLVDA